LLQTIRQVVFSASRLRVHLLLVGLVLAEAVVAASVVADLSKHQLHPVEVVKGAEAAVLGMAVEVAQGVLGVAEVQGHLPRLAHLTPLHLEHRILAMLEQNQQVPRAFGYQL
jgi:hypothetical protein